MYSGSDSTAESDQLKLLRKYVRSYKELRRFSFQWIGARGLSPLPELALEQSSRTHPALRHASPSTPAPLFPHLEYLALDNVIISATQVQRLMQTHKRTLLEIDLENVVLKDGSWHDALASIDGVDVKTTPISITEGDVPIMLAPNISPPQSQRQSSKKEYSIRTGEATKRVRRILLADEIRQGASSSPQSRRVDNKERRKQRVEGMTPSSYQQLKRKCGNLLGWRMRNGPTLVVG